MTWLTGLKVMHDLVEKTKTLWSFGSRQHCTRFAPDFIGNLTRPAIMDSA